MNGQYDFSDILAKVPDYKTFMTVDELDASSYALAEKYPDVVTLFEAGRSRKGHPIICLKIGNGSKNALCFACPHPNEPIGAMTVEYFSAALAERKDFREATGYTWYIIKCVDPDGTRLNEKWFKGPYTIANYSRNFYRPTGYQQVEWTFPIDYKNLHFNKPLPETLAIMKVIDEVKPEFLYSLHNAGFGGAYWYITHDYKDIYKSLHQSALNQGVALHLGEPESPSCTKLYDAVYDMLGASEEYDYLEKYTDTPPESVFDCGTCSSDYAMTKNDCVTLLTELPYFFDARIQDMSEANMTRREAILKNNEISKQHWGKIDSLLAPIRPYLSEDNVFPLLSENIIQHMDASIEAKLNWAQGAEFEAPAKVSEVFDNTTIAKFYNSLSAALTIRTCEFELEKQGSEDKDDHKLQLFTDVKKKAETYHKEICDELEKELDYSVIPIQKLVRIQVECGLLVSQRRLKD